jgi:hypothetical protein
MRCVSPHTTCPRHPEGGEAQRAQPLQLQQVLGHRAGLPQLAERDPERERPPRGWARAPAPAGAAKTKGRTRMRGARDDCGQTGAAAPAAPPGQAIPTSFDDIRAARERIAGQVVLTPCTPSEAFGELFGGRAWFKFENLQRTGSFKERGALNRMLRIPGGGARARGDRGQRGQPRAGRRLPRRAAGHPGHHRDAGAHAAGQGVEHRALRRRVVLHGTVYDEAMAEALRIQARPGGRPDPPLRRSGGDRGAGDHRAGAAGAVSGDGGGGGGRRRRRAHLGDRAAIKALRPEVRVVGVEAAALPAALRAREAGRVVTIPPAETIADGIAVRRIGERPSATWSAGSTTW